MVGGIASVIGFAVIAYWLGINLLHTFLPPGNFDTTSQTTLTQDSEGNFPLYEIPYAQMFSLYRLYSSDESITDDNIEDYMVGVWFQFSPEDDSKKAFTGKPCSEISALDVYKDNEAF